MFVCLGLEFNATTNARSAAQISRFGQRLQFSSVMQSHPQFVFGAFYHNLGNALVAPSVVAKCIGTSDLDIF
jgi:hypothetical protein